MAMKGILTTGRAKRFLHELNWLLLSLLASEEVISGG